MTDDDWGLSRRSLLGAVGTIGGAAALGGAGSMAFFRDTEEFANNELVAGTLDLKVAWQEHYADWLPDTAGGPDRPQETDDARMPSGGETPTFRLPAGSGQSDARPIELVVGDGRGFLGGSRIERANGGLYGGEGSLCETESDATGAPLIDLGDVKPGDFGFALFRLESCTNPAKLWLSGGLQSAAEKGLTEPEREDADEDGAPNATNPALVELLDEIQVAFGVGTTNDLSAANPADNLLPEPEIVDGAPQPATQYSLREFLTLVGKGDGIPLAGDIVAEQGGGSGRNCFAGETGHYVSVVWWLPVDHANQIQSDEVAFDLGFYAEQCRHNATADAFVEPGGDLQGAIDAAAEGDVVEVGPGTFETSGSPLVVDTPGITLRGVGSRPQITRTDSGTGAAVNITADDVTFERFEVTNPDGLLGIRVGDGDDKGTAGSSGVTVRANRVRDVGPVGRLGVVGIIAQTGTHTDLTIECNVVEDLRNEIKGDSEFPTLIGIFIDDDSISNSTIADNIVRGLDSDINSNGIQINVDATDVEIRGNLITDLLAAHAVDSNDADDAVGEFDTFAQGINIGGPTTNVEIVENTITDVRSEDGFVGEAVKIDGDASGITLNQNNLLSTIGVTNPDSNQLDATDNWWGSPSGPEVASSNPPSTTDEDRSDVLGNVTFSPFASSSQ